MVDHRHVVIGFQGSGKTTFAAALWYLLDSRATEVPTALFKGRHTGDYKYLEAIAAAWDNVAYFPRSKAFVEHFPGITMDVAYSAICNHATSRKRGPVGEGESIFYDANGEAHVFWLYSFSNTYDLLTYGIHKRKHSRIYPSGLRVA